MTLAFVVAVLSVAGGLLLVYRLTQIGADILLPPEIEGDAPPPALHYEPPSFRRPAAKGFKEQRKS